MSEQTASRGRAGQDRSEKERSDKERAVLRRDAPRWLWFGVLGGPLAWTVHEIAGWLFVELTCTEGAPGFLGLSLSLITVLTTVIPLAVAVGAWWVAWRATRTLKRREAGEQPSEVPRRVPRALFMAQLGAWMAGLSILLILYDGAAILTLPACAR